MPSMAHSLPQCRRQYFSTSRQLFSAYNTLCVDTKLAVTLRRSGVRPLAVAGKFTEASATVSRNVAASVSALRYSSKGSIEAYRSMSSLPQVGGQRWWTS